MRKNYIAILAIILLGSFTASAQLKQVGSHGKSKTINRNLAQTSQSSQRHTKGSNQTAAVIWYDDFSDLTAWSMSTDGGTTDNWVISTTGPSGTYAITPIASTSAANGFALFDSDLLCSFDQIANISNVTAINCSGHPNVRLRFEEQYRRFYDSTFVYVSNDGTNWTKFPVNTAFINDQETTNPQLVKLNISSVAGNQATVYVRFTFYSPSTLNANAGCGYSWMVDDVLIDDYPSDDVAIVDLGFPSEYTEMPLSQVSAFNLSSKITNEGLNTATNASVNIDIFQNSISNVVYSNTSTVAATIAPDAVTAALTAPAYTPTDTGIYFIRYVAQSTSPNSDGANDTTFRLVVVSDTGYARDMTLITSHLDNVIGIQGGAFAATGTLKVGQIYNFPSAAQIKSVTCYLAFPHLGDSVKASIHTVNVSGAPAAAATATSLKHVITPADTAGNFITMSFATPVSVGPGNICVSVNQVDTNYLSLGFVNDVYTAAKAWYKIRTAAWAKADTSGFIGAFVIRPNIVASPVGVNEIHTVKNNIQVFPNPSNGIINIMNYGNRGSFTVHVYNPVGQLVYSEKYNDFAETTIDLRSQPSGIYNVRIESDKESVTKSIIISNR